MKTPIFIVFGIILLINVALGRDILVEPQYEYKIAGTPSQADIVEVIRVAKDYAEHFPADYIPIDDWDAIALFRKENEELIATSKRIYIVESLSQSNEVFEIRLRELYPPNISGGKGYTLLRTNGSFVVQGVFTWYETEIP